MQPIASMLIEHADAIAEGIMQDWHALGKREPWHRVPEGLDQDHLPDMIRNLARAALVTFFERDARRGLVEVGAEHGQHRFRQGASEEVLSREYELLRWAIWQRLKREFTTEDASQAIIRLDSALTLAHGASLRGFHRNHIEQAGGWEQALDDYTEQWHFPS